MTNNDCLSARRRFVEEFYIQELTPNVVANAVSTVTRICKIFFQIGLFIRFKLIKSHRSLNHNINDYEYY